MIAIDNSALLALGAGCGCPAFAPVVTMLYVAADEEITLTDSTTFSAGDGFKKINVSATDADGVVVKGAITAAAGDAVLDVSTLNQSKPIRVSATVVSDGGCMSDGSAYLLPGNEAEVALTNWDKDFTGASVAG